MTQTVSQAVAQRDTSPSALVGQYRDDFARVLPSHVKPETFVRLAQGALRRDDNLARAAQQNPGSLMAALLDCARLGHDPATEAYYLVPFGGEVQGIEGYRGEIERMYRAGAVTAVKAEVVRQADHWHFDRRTMERPDHQFDDFASADDRGPLRGVYAFAEMVTGVPSRVVVMGRDDVMRHKAMSKGYERPTSPWQRWEESMWLKCAVHELEKWVPSSNEYRRVQAQTAVAASVARIDQTADGRPRRSEQAPAVLDGEVIEAPEPGLDDWPDTAQPGGEA